LRFPKDIFKGLRYPLTWSNGFCGGRGKRDALLEKGRGPMVENYCYNNSFMIYLFIYYFILFYFRGREDEDKRRQENGQTWILFLFKTALFGHTLKKSAHSHFGAWSFLLVHVWFTPSEGPKGFVN
jgi:hypothetical protein